MSAPIVAVILDLFFLVKVQGAAKRAGIDVKSANSAAAAMQLLRAGASLLVVDLNCREVDTVELVRSVKADPALSHVPVMGFISHVQEERKQAALDAGCDRVVARSAFSSRTLELLREASA
jgi:CheY-like chemotaxis protein